MSTFVFFLLQDFSYDFAVDFFQIGAEIALGRGDDHIGRGMFFTLAPRFYHFGVGIFYDLAYNKL